MKVAWRVLMVVLSSRLWQRDPTQTWHKDPTRNCSCKLLRVLPNVVRDSVNIYNMFLLSVYMYVSFGQGSSLLWTHVLRPLYSRPIVLTQEGRSQVDDVCECMRD